MLQGYDLSSSGEDEGFEVRCGRASSEEVCEDPK